MRALLFLVVLLLAGCARAPPPEEPLSVAGTCAQPDVRVEPARAAVGESVRIVASLLNCGRAPLVLREADARCVGEDVLSVEFEHDGRSYRFLPGRELPQARAARGIVGSCGPMVLQPPPTLAPGDRAEASWTWNGSRELLLSWISPTTDLLGYSVTETVDVETPAPGYLQLRFRFTSYDHQATWERSAPLALEGEEPLAHRNAYSRWRAMPPAAFPSPGPGTPVPPERLAEATANASLASRLGMGDASSLLRLLAVEPDPANGTDAWRVTYELRLRGADATYAPVVVPVAGGRALDGWPIAGVPDCRERETECEFRVAAADAVRLARDQGVADATDAALVWRTLETEEGTLGTYAWRISPSGALLDANDGRRLDEWDARGLGTRTTDPS